MKGKTAVTLSNENSPSRFSEGDTCIRPAAAG
jgi:hypothetical protein